MKSPKLLLLLSAILLVAGCGVKKKQLLSTVSRGMHKNEIKMKMGEPIETSRVKNKCGQEVDVWEYSLATVDQNKRGKKITVAVLGTLFFWPALFALPCMDSQYSYDNYFVEFQNNHVARCGKSADLGLERLS